MLGPVKSRARTVRAPSKRGRSKTNGTAARTAAPRARDHSASGPRALGRQRRGLVPHGGGGSAAGGRHGGRASTHRVLKVGMAGRAPADEAELQLFLDRKTGADTLRRGGEFAAAEAVYLDLYNQRDIGAFLRH